MNVSPKLEAALASVKATPPGEQISQDVIDYLKSVAELGSEFFQNLLGEDADEEGMTPAIYVLHLATAASFNGSMAAAFEPHMTQLTYGVVAAVIGMLLDEGLIAPEGINATLESAEEQDGLND